MKVASHLHRTTAMVSTDHHRRVTFLIGAMILALACFGAYFFVLKLIDMSRQEDCFMSGRRNCAPLEVPYDR
jgi:flagellar biogenesis protein FliO